MPLLCTRHLSFVFFVFLHILPPCMLARQVPKLTVEPLTRVTVNNYYNSTWYDIDKLLNSRRGSHVSGISKLKSLLRRFGYLPGSGYSSDDDVFDPGFEAAIIRYQSKLGLPVTGKLDADTLTQIFVPRCGVPDADTVHTLHARKNYVFFPGKPRWARNIPMTLTYAFSPDNLIRYLTLPDIKRVFKRAFAKWASVIPVSFVETDDYGYVDIKIGFYSGDHGDGEPFDGVLGVLAHSFSPENGKFHLDAAETWAIDFGEEKSPSAVDLESVAVHEIGHLLGLAHTPVKEAVMYPSLKPRDKKVDLAVDDIKGVQALYGSNPKFTFSASLESDTSDNAAIDTTVGSFQRVSFVLVSIVLFLHAL